MRYELISHFPFKIIFILIKFQNMLFLMTFECIRSCTKFPTDLTTIDKISHVLSFYMPSDSCGVLAVERTFPALPTSRYFSHLGLNFIQQICHK